MTTIALPFLDRVRMAARPLAHPDSVIACGQARFTVLTPRLIRLEWAAGGAFEDRGTFAFPARYAEPPPFAVERRAERLEIRTDALTLRYHDDGQPFSPHNLCIQLTLNSQTVTWTPGKVNRGNLRGTRRTLDQCAGAADLEEGLISRDGWSLYDDSGKPVWDRAGEWIEPRGGAAAQDWYFFGYGHDYKAALADYVRFGGQTPLVPRYVLGGWWSRFWSYSDADLKALVHDFAAYEIPLDVLVIDMDWHTPHAWTGYTWNRELFPDPAAFLAWVHAQGLYATLNLHPAQGVQAHEEIYPQFAGLLGHDTASGAAVRFRPADKAFMRHYFEQLHHPLEEQGVDFWWLDWQQEEVDGFDPLAWLNHLHFRDSARRGTRPMLYSRWGGLGNHRYPIGFSGDAFATWEALRFQAYFTPTAANVGYGWWSHDIGGHFGATDPELYARWVQFGAVSPCLRLHSTKDPLAERRPWAFPEPVYEAAKAAFHLRYQLLPYLYSAARAASQVGLSLALPMYYQYPETEDAYLAREQYFGGSQLFVRRVDQPADPATGLAAVDVWIPEGDWIEYTTLQTYSGPRWIRLEADLDRIPMFVKAGAILPLAPPTISRTRDFDGSRLIVTVYPGADGQFELYEDDGGSEAYQQGAYATTNLGSTLLDDNTLAIHIDGSQGQFAGLPPSRSLELRLRGLRPPQSITVDEAASDAWQYDEAARELVVTLGESDRAMPRRVVVHAENLRSAAALAEKAPDQPLFHVNDYALYEDARNQLGALVIAAPPPFEAEIRWELLTAGGTTFETVTLKDCATRQIIPCPFSDDGSLRACRWRVVANVGGQHFEYGSATAYPAINRWQARIYSRQQPPGDESGWTTVAQTQAATPNLRQPYGIILLEHERERIAAEPLEARLRATLRSAAARKALLHVQAIGSVGAFLNGVALPEAEPSNEPAALPMYPSWMTPAHRYFRLPLQAGANLLELVTQPNPGADCWGIGATVLDGSGEILLLDVEDAP